MPRSQFNIRTLLWLMLVVAAFLGGMAAEHRAVSIRATSRENELERVNGLLRQEVRRRLSEARVLEARLEERQERGELKRRPRLPPDAPPFLYEGLACSEMSQIIDRRLRNF